VRVGSPGADDHHIVAIASALAASFLTSAPRDVRDELAATAVSVSAWSGMWVEPPRARMDVGIVVNGRVQSFTVSMDGCVVPLALLGPGRLFSSSSILPTTEALVLAVSPSVVAWLRTDLVRIHLRTAPGVALALAQEMGQLSEQMRLELEMRAVVGVRERLAARLAEFGARGSAEVELTHEQLAMVIGSRREVVSRHLRALEDQGILALGRGRIRIRDPERLGEAASA
jgi:CRP/FNR family transcriptional regulator